MDDRLIPIREFLQNGGWTDYVVSVPSFVRDDKATYAYIFRKLGHLRFEIKSWDENGCYSPIQFTLDELKNE